jgi:hypothetical protein
MRMKGEKKFFKWYTVLIHTTRPSVLESCFIVCTGWLIWNSESAPRRSASFFQNRVLWSPMTSLGSMWNWGVRLPAPCCRRQVASAVLPASGCQRRVSSVRLPAPCCKRRIAGVRLPAPCCQRQVASGVSYGVLTLSCVNNCKILESKEPPKSRNYFAKCKAPLPTHFALSSNRQQRQHKTHKHTNTPFRFLNLCVCGLRKSDSRTNNA